MEVLGKMAYGAEIASNGGWRVVAPLKLVQHALAKWGHRNLLPMTSHPNPACLAELASTISPSRQRLRSNRQLGQVIADNQLVMAPPFDERMIAKSLVDGRWYRNVGIAPLI